MLKKILVISILHLIFISGIIFPQRVKWSESFESDEFLLSGWKLLNNDSSTVAAEVFSSFEFFRIGMQYAKSGNKFLKLGFINSNSYNRIDDWIITPKLYDIRENDTMSFWCGAIDRTYKDSLKVYVSVTGNNTNDFVLIDHFKVDGPQGAWHKKSYDLSAYKGSSIYFAINYFLVNAGPQGQSSDNLWIDNFELKGKGHGGADVKSFELYQNFPNPFNPSTDISFSIPENSNVSIKLYDISGREIAVLVNGNFEKGIYSISFNSESAGSGLSSGVYFYVMRAVWQGGEFTESKKMELIK